MKLEVVRRARLLTVKELAKRAGVSERTILNAEGGTVQRPTMRICKALAEALDLAPHMIDEFQPVVGTSADLHALLPQQEIDAFLRSVQEGDELGLVDDEGMAAVDAEVTTLGREPTDEEFRAIWARHAIKKPVTA